MTLLYAAHNLLPPLAGYPEPMPLVSEPRRLNGLRHILAGIAGDLTNAVGSGNARRRRRRRLRAAAPQSACWRCSPPSSASRPSSSTACSRETRRGWIVAIGVGIIAIFILTIVRAGLLSAVAALFTHFVLLRAPITTDFSSWHATVGIWHVGVVLGGRASARATDRGRIRTQGERVYDFLTLTRIGVPMSPNDSRSWFARNRS